MDIRTFFVTLFPLLCILSSTNLLPIDTFILCFWKLQTIDSVAGTCNFFTHGSHFLYLISLPLLSLLLPHLSPSPFLLLLFSLSLPLRYTDPPLKPQTEEWRVLSWPHPDWMLYIYCGSTPTGPYAGQVHFRLHALFRWLWASPKLVGLTAEFSKYHVIMCNAQGCKPCAGNMCVIQQHVRTRMSFC